MKINREQLNKLIAESIKKHLLSEDLSNYPLGAEYDSNAPWNQSDADVKEEEGEEKFPTIPFISVILSWWVGDDSNVIDIIRQGIEGSCPGEIVVHARYSYTVGCEPPDEDGYYFTTRENEQQEECGVYFIINGKYISFIDWVNKSVPQGSELHKYLSDAYTSMMDLVRSDSPSMEDFERNMREVKQQIQTLG